MPTTRDTGGQWEKVAEGFLRKRGLKTLTRNYHCRFGEIDLVMIEKDTLVFTEVRFRGNQAFGSGADSVTRAKQGRIITAARRYLQFHHQHRLRPCRFDVVSIGTAHGEPVLEWIKGAFTA